MVRRPTSVQFTTKSLFSGPRAYRGAGAAAGRFAMNVTEATNQVDQNTYDAFWTESEPVFHSYDSGANIDIEFSEGPQSLGRETRLQPREDSDAEADADAGSDEASAAVGDETGHGGLDEKYKLDHIRQYLIHPGGRPELPRCRRNWREVSGFLSCGPQHGAAGTWVITVDVGDYILPLSFSSSVWTFHVARAAPFPAGSYLCGDEGHHELPERQGGRAVGRLLPGVQQHHAVDPLQSLGSPRNAGDCHGGADVARVGG
ncbi:hypothetical protein V491_00533 [Pseudogymnoascus sp. VKM F-3775]|nr:hypothetical protein V491_00533 [Pseudogymnoascus sp. VKM F-3775]